MAEVPSLNGMLMRSGLLSKLKLKFIKAGIIKHGKRPRRIKFGFLKNVNFQLDYECRTQLYLGLWEKEASNFLKKLSEGIATAIDIGAGEGEYALYFLKKTSAKVIFACEPNKDRREILMSNVKLNYPLRNCKLEFISEAIGSASKNQYTLDSLIPYVETPCLITVDIDGGELDLLHGAKAFLKLPQLRWIMETHSKQLEERCIQLFQQEGYIIRIVPNAWWRLFIPENRPYPHNRWLMATRRIK